MSGTVDDLTVEYEEDGVITIRETGKAVLSKGAWATVLFRYQEWDAEAGLVPRVQKSLHNHCNKLAHTVSDVDIINAYILDSP
ncbi:MAG: hypothetical protein ACQGQP_07160, partial [Desulfovibrio sp.]